MKKMMIAVTVAVTLLVIAPADGSAGLEPDCEPTPQYIQLLDNAEKWFTSEIPGKQMEDLRLHTRILGSYHGTVIQKREILVGDEVVESQRLLYSRDETGNVFFHGDLDERVMDEPILWVDAPLSIGKTWVQQAPAYGELMPSEVTHYVFACLEEDEIICPNGTFPVYRVFLSTIQPSGETTNCNFWYSETCGLVRCCLDNQRVYLLTKFIPGEDVNPDLEFHNPLSLSEPLGSTSVPNPANPLTRIEFQLSADVPVSVEVFDVTGKRIRTLLDGQLLSAGARNVAWNGTDDAGRSLASGQYLFRVRAGNLTETGRVTLIR